MLKLVIADDVDLVLCGIHSLVDSWAEASILGSYQTVSDLYAGLAQHGADVVLLDDRIDPDCAPLQVIQHIQTLLPQAHIIVLGSQADGMVVQEFFARGIQGYLYKSDPLADTLLPAIRAVAQGKLYVSPTASAEHMTAMRAGRRRYQLTEEALTVLRLLAAGNHVNQIALRLQMSRHRVYSIRNRLRARFGADNNEALISQAMLEGFLP